MSSYNNRKSVMPDVTPKPRSNFTVRNRAIAIILVTAFIAILTLTFGAFTVSRDEENAKTAAALKNKEESLLEVAKKLAEHEDELKLRETKLNVRETELDKRETALETAQTELENSQAILASDLRNFTIEEEEFYDKQSRIKELCEALLIELVPEEE